MPLLCEKFDHVAVLTLSRPEARNAWCADFMRGFRERLPELEEDRDVRCVILTGDDKGGAFSAGADLKNPRTHTENSVADFLEDLPRRRRSSPISLLSDFSKPVVAAVNGYAIGIGCILTFCCDLIVASERAEWRLPQVALGILPAAAISLIIRSPPCELRSTATTAAPSFATHNPVPRPIPLATPVIIATLPSSRAIEVSSRV